MTHTENLTDALDMIAEIGGMRAAMIADMIATLRDDEITDAADEIAETVERFHLFPTEHTAQGAEIVADLTDAAEQIVARCAAIRAERDAEIVAAWESERDAAWERAYAAGYVWDDDETNTYAV